MSAMDVTQARFAVLTPAEGPIIGQARLPGSKSVTNRALLLAALAKGESRLTGMLRSDDTRYMAEALRALGVGVVDVSATETKIGGTGRLGHSDQPLFLGNAGTAMRFLTAAAALADGPLVLDGDQHMRKRPIGPLVDALNRLGVEAEAPSLCPPVTVKPVRHFTTERLSVDGGLSSQYISALLMMAAAGPSPLEIVIEGGQIGGAGYIDITLAVMRAFGNAPDQTGPQSWRVTPSGYAAQSYRIEPDASAATYLWAAEKLTNGRIDLGIAADAMSQPDAAAHKIITQFPHFPSEIDGSQMQDAVPTLAVMAAFCKSPVRFTGIDNLRVKECDRTAALHEGLNRIQPGLAAMEGNDLIVQGGLTATTSATRVEIRTFDDHRMAMCFALAGLLRNDVAIENPACTAKTFPDYWDVLAGLGVEVRLEG